MTIHLTFDNPIEKRNVYI